MGLLRCAPRWRAALTLINPKELLEIRQGLADVARLLVTKCPHAPLNTNMHFGSAYDKDFKGCST